MGEVVKRQRLNGVASPSYVFTDEQRAKVKLMCECGITQEQIALYFNMDTETLRKHCREELAQAKIEKSIRIGSKIYEEALNGNTGCLVWWSKTQMGWSETTKQEISGPNGQAIVLGVDGPPQETRAQWEARMSKARLNGVNGTGEE